MATRLGWSLSRTLRPFKGKEKQKYTKKKTIFELRFMQHLCQRRLKRCTFQLLFRKFKLMLNAYDGVSWGSFIISLLVPPTGTKGGLHISLYPDSVWKSWRTF